MTFDTGAGDVKYVFHSWISFAVSTILFPHGLTLKCRILFLLSVLLTCIFAAANYCVYGITNMTKLTFLKA